MQYVARRIITTKRTTNRTYERTPEGIEKLSYKVKITKEIISGAKSRAQKYPVKYKKIYPF